MTGDARHSVFSGHPRGVFLLSGTEMWERFSYYGMSALLVLFLSASPITGGYGWAEADALRLFGIYSALVFISPVAGGWLATTWLGERRGILIGGILIASGHLLIGAPAYGPWLIERFTAVPVESLLRESGLVLGTPMLSAETHATLMSALAQRGIEGGEQALTLAWYLKGWCIYTALALIIAGTGLLKAPISSLVGKLYAPGDPRREAGFTLFMVGIWLGALGSDLIVGALGEKVGWHFGLAVAGAGMVVGLTLYVLCQDRLLGEAGRKPEGSADGTRETLRFDADERRRLLALAVMAVFSVLFSIAYYQQSGALHLLLFEHGDRTVFGFTIPATWAMMVTTLSFVFLAPLASLLYARLEARGINVDVVTKQVIGLAAMAFAYAILWSATTGFDRNHGARISILWFLVAYVLFAVGDVCIWPPQISAVSRFAPRRCQSLMIGAWYIAVGVGTWLASAAGALSYDRGLSFLLGWLLVLCAVAACGLLMLRPWLNRLLMHGETSA